MLSRGKTVTIEIRGRTGSVSYDWQKDEANEPFANVATRGKTVNRVYEKLGGDGNELCHTIRPRDSQGNEPSTNHSDGDEEYNSRLHAHRRLIDFSLLLQARLQRACVPLIGIYHAINWRGRARSGRYLSFGNVEPLRNVRWICNRLLNV
jgi:hypothetical protein